MFIIYGTRTYGTIDAPDGTQHATRFVHVYYLPLVPIGGMRLISEDRGVPIPLDWRSVLLAYGRVWGFLGVAGLIANVYLNFEHSYAAGAAWGVVALAGIALWAASVLRFGVRRPFSPVGWGLALGVPLLALLVSVGTGVAEHQRRQLRDERWADRSEKDGPPSAALLALAKEEAARAKEKKLEKRRARCEAGEGQECNELGYELSKTDPVASLDAYAQGCELDSGMACFNEALVVSKTDAARAAQKYEQACELGFAKGCNNLATTLEKTEPKRAAMLFDKGCELKHGLACRNLARLNEKKSPRLAMTLMKKACELGDTVACSSKQR